MSSTDLQEQVREFARELKGGQSSRHICPVCVAIHESSFVIRRDAYEPWKVWFRCYRAKCGVKGMLQDATTQEHVRLTLQVNNPKQAARVDPDAFQAMPQELRSKLAEDYDIDIHTLLLQQLRYDPLDNAVVLPVRVPRKMTTNNHARYKQIGWQHRLLDRKGIRNLWASAETQSSMGAVKSPAHHPTVVLVENLFSAYRIQSRGTDCDAIALLGHTLTGPDAAILASFYSRAIVLLDPDTWPSGPVEVLKALAPYDIKAEARFLAMKPKDAPRPLLLEVLK